jgi:hypothetical protein
MPVTVRLDVPCDPESLAQAAKIIASLREMTSPPIQFTAGWATGLPSRTSFGLGTNAADDQGDGSERLAPARCGDFPPAAGDSAAADHVGVWLARLGPGPRAFWRAAARYAVEHTEFTFADLEAATGIGRATLHSRYRTSFRAIRSAKALGPMRVRKDPKTRHFVYAMPPAVREKILALTTGDPG